MADSGAQLFLGGEIYFRQLDELALLYCVAKTISDQGWTDYLDGTLRMSKQAGCSTRATMSSCLHAYPNAKQRRMAADFMAKNGLRQGVRVAVLTDSTLLQGAMTAFSWAMPNMDGRAFSSKAAEDGFKWLHEVAAFSESAAIAAWNEARTKLGTGASGG